MLEGRSHAVNFRLKEAELCRHLSPRGDGLPYFRCDLMRFIRTEFEIRSDFQ